MRGRTLFYLVASRTSPISPPRIAIHYNQAEAREAVEEIRRGGFLKVEELVPGETFVEAWFPHDKQGIKAVAQALADGDLHALRQAAELAAPNTQGRVNQRRGAA